MRRSGAASGRKADPMPRRPPDRMPDPRFELDAATEAAVVALVWPQGEARRVQGYRAYLMRRAGLTTAEIAAGLGVQERRVLGLLQVGRLVAQRMEGRR